MTILPNSVEARDIAYQMHPNVNLRKFEKTGGLVIESGEGIYVTDSSGKRYIEAMAGLWSVALGFGEQRLVDAATKQMQKLPYYHTFSYKTHGPSVDLAELLIELSPVPMSKVHFTSSGSEANDLVAKMVWYRSNALGKKEKKKIIGRIKGYHGVTIASASITGLPRNHESFDLPLDRMLHTACPSYVHFGRDGESEAEFTARILKELEDLILSEGPETVAAFWGEPVMGAGGVLLPPEGYWEGVQAILKKYDILLVVDEVICGFGRTGKMFACETYGIKPDVLVVSKQISSSYMPLSAIIMNDNFYQPIADESDRIGSFGHGYTASGPPGCDGSGPGEPEDHSGARSGRQCRPAGGQVPRSSEGACRSPAGTLLARCRPSRRAGDKAVGRHEAGRCDARHRRCHRGRGCDHPPDRRIHLLLPAADHHRGAAR